MLAQDAYVQVRLKELNFRKIISPDRVGGFFAPLLLFNRTHMCSYIVCVGDVMNYTYDPEQAARIINYYNPPARATLTGSAEYPDIYGEVWFYNIQNGVLVVTSVENLPKSTSGFYGFHLHGGESCTGNAQDSFADAKGHYNPKNVAHPMHAGDFPPVISNNGSGFSVFVTDRFTIPEIIGRTVIIHSMPDDFKTQPSGGSGEKIACGVIRR